MTIVKSKKVESENPDATLVRQIDELERIATEERDSKLGQGWFEEVRDFYSLTGVQAASPTFRPKLTIPKLQSRMLNEATDLSDQQPKVFILRDSKRDRKTEDAFTEHWRQNYFNNKIFLAELWSLYAGTGFIQVGFDAFARRGRGEVWMEVRDPSTVFPDPGNIDPDHWVYLILKDRLYIDEIRATWPDNGYRLRGPLGAAQISTDQSSIGLTLPEGPMRMAGGTPNQNIGSSDGRLEVRYLYIRDYTSEEISKEDRERIQQHLHPLIPAPKRKLKYPNGRWVVECNGVILADGSNPVPFRGYPITPYHSMPSLDSFWCPPPIRYTKGIQELSERQYTQNYENAVRLNNGTWFIDEKTGLTADEFGGLPAQICIINANSPVPQCVWPSAMPAHMMQMPDTLLKLQDDIQGFTPGRMGEGSKGNVSVGLQDATIFQGQYLTRMRARLMAESVQRSAELVFWTMARNLKVGTAFLASGEDSKGMQLWPEMGPIDDYEVFLDQTSIRPVSMAAMRQLVLGLLKDGHLPLKYALEALEFPDAQEIADVQRQELEASVLSKLKRPR